MTGLYRTTNATVRELDQRLLRDLGDRRAVRLELTASGRTLVDSVAVALNEHVRDVLKGVKARTRANLVRDLEEVERSVRAAR